MRVKELSERSGVEPHIVRYYTRLGLLQPVRERGNRYRSYAQQDVQRVCFIRGARRLGFGLKEVRVILTDADRGSPLRPAVRTLIARRARENAQRLWRLNRLQKRVEAFISSWTALPGEKCTGDSLSQLIDLVASDGEHLI